jgi:Trypsin-co-occurring domain 1
LTGASARGKRWDTVSVRLERGAMPTKLIRLQDGTLVEVEVAPGEARAIAGGEAEKVNSALDRIQPILVNVSKSVTDAWRSLPRHISVEQVEIELGLSFEGEGNIFVTKARAGANLTVTLTLSNRISGADGPDAAADT